MTKKEPTRAEVIRDREKRARRETPSARKKRKRGEARRRARG